MTDSFDDLLETLDQIQASRASEGPYSFHAEADFNRKDDSSSSSSSDDDNDRKQHYSEPERNSVNIDLDFGFGRESLPPPPPPAPIHHEHHSPKEHHDSHRPHSVAPINKSGDMSNFQRQSIMMPAPPRSTGGASDCHKCGNTLFGHEYIEAGGKHFHKDHFQCGKCHSQLHSTYFDHHGQILCQNCAGDLLPCNKCRRGITGNYMIVEGIPFHKECVDRKHCAQCHGAIEDTVLTAMGKTWHQRCFKCNQCNKELGLQFVTKDGHPVCNDCATRGRPSCAGCHKALTGQFLSFGSGSYHDECFVCHDCRTRLGTSGFFNVKGNLKCQRCAKN